MFDSLSDRFEGIFKRIRGKGRISEADIDERVAEVAKGRNADPGQVYASLQKAGRIKEIERAITEEKVFKWLLDQNTVE